MISLSKFNKKKSFSVHRLVAKTFIENINNKPEINHKDLNPYNNKAENLEWVTSSENSIHSFKNGRIMKKGYNSPCSKLNKEQVIKIRNRYKKGESVRSITKDYNVSHTIISYIVNNKTYNNKEMLAYS